MSKVVPLLFVGAGAAAVSVGGVYMLNSRSNSAHLGFKTLEEFKQKKGGHLTSKFFGQDLDFNSKGTAISSGSGKVDANTFPGSENPESQLVVNWERTDSKSSVSEDQKKWKGGLRWLWNFKRGNKGFSMFVTTKPSSTANTLDLEGGLYILTKSNDTSPKWTIANHKELSGKKINKSDSKPEGNLPKIGTEIKAQIQDEIASSTKDYWGFIASESDLDKLCGTDANCPTDPDREKTFAFRWHWDHSSSDKKEITSWCSNAETLFNNLFTKSDVDLKTALSSLKGAWTKA